MKKTQFMAFLLVISAITATAQKSIVLDAFSKHGIDAGMLNADNVEAPADYAYDLKQTTITSAKKNTIVAKFDPSAPKEEQSGSYISLTSYYCYCYIYKSMKLTEYPSILKHKQLRAVL